MSILHVSDIPLHSDAPAGSAADKLRTTAAAVKVSFTWWGVSRSLSAGQKEEVASTFGAKAKRIRAGKTIVDTEHPAFAAMGKVRSRIRGYWESMTLPYVEDGVRLLRQDRVTEFCHRMEEFRAELVQAEADLNVAYDSIREQARIDLADLFNAADYPPVIRDLFRVTWEFPSVEPPSYLLQLDPKLYAQQQAMVQARFAEAVQLAEGAFLTEFAKLVEHLAERLAPEVDGSRKRFHESNLENLTAFFARFGEMNLGSNAQLDALVKQVQGLVQGVTPQKLKGSGILRDRLAAQLANVTAALDPMLTDAPRRHIVMPPAAPPAPVQEPPIQETAAEAVAMEAMNQAECNDTPPVPVS